MGTSTSKPKQPPAGKKVAKLKIESATKTGILSLSGHKLKKFPEQVLEIPKISSLDLSTNQLSSLPSQMATLANLKTLKLENNELQSSHRLAKLTTINLSNNQLTTDSLAQLPPSLTKLTATNNLIDDWAPCVTLVKLQALDLSQNRLSTLSISVFGSLRSAMEILLDDNTISAIPMEIGALKKLKILSLRRNIIEGQVVDGFQSLPVTLFTDTNLERLNLEGNPITRRDLDQFDGVDAWLERQSKTKQKDLALYMGE